MFLVCKNLTHGSAPSFTPETSFVIFKGKW